MFKTKQLVCVVEVFPIKMRTIMRITLHILPLFTQFYFPKMYFIIVFYLHAVSIFYVISLGDPKKVLVVLHCKVCSSVIIDVNKFRLFHSNFILFLYSSNNIKIFYTGMLPVDSVRFIFVRLKKITKISRCLWGMSHQFCNL